MAWKPPYGNQQNIWAKPSKINIYPISAGISTGFSNSCPKIFKFLCYLYCQAIFFSPPTLWFLWDLGATRKIRAAPETVLLYPTDVFFFDKSIPHAQKQHGDILVSQRHGIHQANIPETQVHQYIHDGLHLYLLGDSSCR